MQGRKTGGRQKGSKNKAPSKAALAQAAAKAVAGTGLSPLEYMLQVMRDPLAKPERRDDMAKAAAPYVHPKLASTEVTGPGGGPVQIAAVEWRVVDPVKTGS